jgi:exodeoxyribonuclease V alpha subunit
LHSEKADAVFIQHNDPQEALNTVRNLVSRTLPVEYGFEQSDIMVLTPSNKGPLGTIILNSELQNSLNPLTQGKIELKIGSTTFRVGDRVCQRTNNYQIDATGVYNGDLGIISKIDPNSKSITVTLWDGRSVNYKSTDIPQLGLAYALTVHRSQGSEIPCVILVLHDSHSILLERQLVYTGVTRAKKQLIIIGSRRALNIAVSKISSRKRNTSIVEQLTAE